MRKAMIALLSMFAFAISPTAFAAVDAASLTSVLQRWNKAKTDKDMAGLAAVYAANVLYYGASTDRKGCVRMNADFAMKHPNFSQIIMDAPAFELLPDGKVMATFTKRATLGGKAKEYPSYLVLQQETDAQWRITVEGDLVTDHNLAAKKTSAGRSAATACLEFEPEITHLIGPLSVRMFTDANGRAEKAWILTLSQPVCVVTKDLSQGSINPDRLDGVRNVQLLFSAGGPQELLGREVGATGTLMAPHTAHHHGDALLEVLRIHQNDEGP